MPAPSRYVIDRPGIPGDAIDATDLGSWFQPGDQEADAVAGIPMTPGGHDPDVDGVWEGGETTAEDPPAPAEPPAEILLFAKLITEETGGSAEVSAATWTMTHTTWNTKSGNPSGEDDDPFYLSHTLEGGRGGSGVTIAPYPHQMYWHDGWRPDWPDGAIGYEVEQVELAPDFWVPVADPVSAEFTITLTPSTHFGQVTNLYARAVVNSDWGSGPVEWSFSGPLLDMSVDQTAPMTITSADNAEFGTVLTEVAFEGVLDPPHVGTITVSDFSHAPPHSGLVGFHAQVGKHPEAVTAEPAPNLENGVAIMVSANADVVGVYTIRPPRIRWIYGRPPYRRLTQRADGRAGGARRIHPRPKSVQGSNRRGAGSIT